MKQMYKGLLTAICGIGLNSLSWGQCFNPAVTPQVTTNAFALTTGDFNSDGKLDIVAANTNNRAVLVLLNDGNGGFSNGTNFNAGELPGNPAVGDLNADGKLDIIVTNPSRNLVSILLNDGMGGFSGPIGFGAGAGPGALVISDFNGDGRPDLATSNFVTSTVSVLLNDGRGFFYTVTSFGTGFNTGPNSLAVGDFNGDGKPDLATGNVDRNSNSISLLLNNGSGSFNAVTTVSLGNNSPNKVAVGDFNADGKLDLAAATSGPTATNVSILLGNGVGGFAPGTTQSVRAGAVALAVGDFNTDGKPDLAVTSIGPVTNTVSVLLGSGNGSFDNPVSFNTGIFPVGVAAADFNNDGRPDLATANSSDNAVSILLNCTIPPTPPTGTGLTLAAPAYDCNSGQLQLSATGGNGQLIEYRIAGLRDWSSNNVFTIPTYQRTGTSFTLEARQSGQVVSLPFATACQTTPPVTPPTPPVTPPTGTGLSLAAPAYNCNSGQLQLSTTGGNGQLVEYRIAGLRDWAASNTFTVPTYQLTGTSFTLEARQSGQVVSLAFTSACQTSTTPPTPPVTPPTPPAGTPLTVSAQGLNCQTGVLQLVAAGGDGSAVAYKVPGLGDYTASGSFTVPTYQRSGTNFTLYARQSGREVTATYTATCPVSVRLATPETARAFDVVVYPNPVGEQFTVGVRGAAGSSVRFQLTNLSGQTVVEQRVPVVSDVHTETLRMPASGSGLYLLRVSTNGQSKTVKVLKP